jgi:hypothetical protein
MKYEVILTPHNTKRLFIDAKIMNNQNSVKILNWLSIWGGPDKYESSWPGFPGKVVSWEFSVEISDYLISKGVEYPPSFW